MTSDNHPHHDKDQDIDQHSGVETTGHEWDGIKELNNPAPRWWLWVFFLCFVWAVGYWFVYPAWPTLSGEGERGGTAGSKGWTQYSQLQEQQADIMARRAGYLARFHDSTFEQIINDPELYAFAVAGGKSAFKDNCATCHGTGGAGADGYPNLNDDDWLWGGTHEAIYTTLKYGIRAVHEESRFSEMPSFNGMLSDAEMQEVSRYVISLSDGGEFPENGKTLFEGNCASCHGAGGTGSYEFGAPNLADAIWFYGDGTEAGVTAQMRAPRHGMMPNWNERLSDDTIRQLTVYVHSLGGGE